MAMDKLGLTKLIEECGELVQICAKKAAYLNTDNHPDNAGSLKIRLEEEIADVLAACSFVSEKLELNADVIEERAFYKKNLFEQWDEQNDTSSNT